MNYTKRNIFVNWYAKSGSNLASSGVGLQAYPRQASLHAAWQAPSYLASHLAFFQKCVQNRGKTGALKRFVPSRILLHFARNTADRREKSGTNRPVLTAAGTNLPMARGTRNALGLERGAWVRLPPSPPEGRPVMSDRTSFFASWWRYHRFSGSSSGSGSACSIVAALSCLDWESRWA